MPSILTNQFDPWQLLPKVPRENRWELAICIFVAFLFWLIISLTTKTHSINKSVEIAFAVGEDEVLLEPKTATAEATISGPGWELLWSNVFQPVIRVNIYRNREDSKLISLVDVNAVVADALYSNETSLGNVVFSPIRLITEAKARKKLAVKPEVRLVYAEGFRAKSSIKISPDSVTVLGGQSILDAMSVWPTDTLSITGLSEDFSQEVRLQKAGDGLVINPATVTISQEVEVFTEKGLYVPVEVINLPEQDSFSVFPQQVLLRVSVLQSNYDKIKTSGFRLVADLHGMRTADGRNSVPLALVKRPQEALNVEYNPKAAEFFLFKKNTSSPD